MIAQELRTFIFNNNEISYYLFSNMTPSFTQYPNHNAKFIMVNEYDNLLENSKRSKINNEDIFRIEKYWNIF
jgi:hypothetical protein